MRVDDYFETGFRFSYLRTSNELEINLIITRGKNEFVAIEIKSTSNPDISEIQKLINLTAGLQDCEKYMICTTKNSSIVDGVKVMNWQQGLAEIFSFPYLK